MKKLSPSIHAFTTNLSNVEILRSKRQAILEQKKVAQEEMSTLEKNGT